MPHVRAFAGDDLENDFDDMDDEDFDSDHYDDDPFDDNDRDLSYARLLNRSGVECHCERCGTTFTGMPGHGVCSPCADKIEQGWDY